MPYAHSLFLIPYAAWTLTSKIGTWQFWEQALEICETLQQLSNLLFAWLQSLPAISLPTP